MAMSSKKNKKKSRSTPVPSKRPGGYSFASNIQVESQPPSYDFWHRAILFLFHLLIFTLPLFFTWVNEELFEFNKIILVYIFTVLIAAFWIGKMIHQKRLIFRRSIFDIPIAIFLISQILSTIFSIHLHTSLFGYYTRFHGGLFSTLSYILLFYAFISNLSKKDLKPLFLTSFASAFLVTLIAIPEHFGHSFSCLLINLDQAIPQFGLAAFTPHNFPLLYNVTCWVQDVQNRVFATFGQPNWLAAYAITLIPLGLSLAITPSEKTEGEETQFSPTRFGFFVISLLLITSLVFTKSRSGIIGFIGGITIFILGMLWKWLRLKSAIATQATVMTVGAGLAFLALLLVYGTPYTPTLSQLWQKYHQPKSVVQVQPAATSSVQATEPTIDQGGTSSVKIREIVWTGALKVWQRYPLFGSGVETFAYSYFKDRPIEHNLTSEWDFVYNKAHNEFVNFLATTGAVGLLSYCLLLGSFIGFPFLYFFSPGAFEKLTRKLLSLPNFSVSPDQQFTKQIIALAITSGIVALSISNFFGFSTVTVTVLLFLYPAFFILISDAGFLEAQAEKIKPKTLRYQVDEPEMFSFQQVASFSGLAIVTTLLLYNVYILWRADFLFTQGKRINQSGRITEGTPLIEDAIALFPQEDYYYPELAYAYARLALAFSQEGNATIAARLANQSLDTAQELVHLNPVSPGDFNTQSDIYSSLSVFEPSLLVKAKESLLKARELSPTDAKILYHLALIELRLQDTQAGMKDLEETVRIRSNYEAARMSLAGIYQNMGKLNEAKQQYEYVLQFIQPKNLQAQDALKQIATASSKIKK
jgi:putative inorganic carbon (HCO3(-)) transporter